MIPNYCLNHFVINVWFGFTFILLNIHPLKMYSHEGVCYLDFPIYLSENVFTCFLNNSPTFNFPHYIGSTILILSGFVVAEVINQWAIPSFMGNLSFKNSFSLFCCHYQCVNIFSFSILGIFYSSENRCF